MSKGVAVFLIIRLVFLILIIGLPYFLTAIIGHPARPW